MLLNELLKQISPVNRVAYEDCQHRFDQVAKPIGSLGELETLLARIAAIFGSADIDITKKCVLVFCADNGVADEGVAQSGSEVTTAIASMMTRQKSSICVMAKACNAETFVYDVGMRDTVPGLIPHKFMHGTGNIAIGPAMPREIAIKALELGIDLVGEMKDQGFRLIATGEAGIGNTTTTSAMASVLLEKPVVEVTGRGAGLSDAGLAHKRMVIEQAIAYNSPNSADVLDVLSKIGGLDIATMTGVFLGGAVHGLPVLMDGVISAVAALCATQLNPLTREYIIPSHLSAEPAASLLCQELGFSPIIQADLRLGEGTGAVALFPLLDMTAAVYHQAATFADIAVEDYKRQ